MGSARQITRTNRTGGALRALAGKCRHGARFAACWLWRWFWPVIRAAWLRRPTGWTGNHGAIGFLAPTRQVSRG
jgi:hypothetical protein